MASKTASRRLPDYMAAPVLDHGAAIGELVWASNYCLIRFALLFARMFAESDREMASEVWRTARSDRAQLDMLLSAIQVTRILKKGMKRNLTWAVRSAMRLAEIRNDAVHHSSIVDPLPSRGGPSMLVVGLSMPRARKARLSKLRSMTKHFRRTKSDFVALTAYLDALFAVLEHGQRATSPRRPRLASLS